MLAIMELAQANPYLWGYHHINYDASLDPIEWSRSFVKDAIRKPRLHRQKFIIHNSLHRNEDKLLSEAQDYKDFSKKLFLSHSKYGAKMQKKLNRRKHRMNIHHRYGFV